MGLNDLAPTLDQDTQFLPTSPERIMDSSGTTDDTNAESDDQASLETLNNSSLPHSVQIRINPVAAAEDIPSSADVGSPATLRADPVKDDNVANDEQYLKEDCDTMKTLLYDHHQPTTSHHGNNNGNRYMKNGPNGHHGNHHGNHVVNGNHTNDNSNITDRTTDRTAEKTHTDNSDRNTDKYTHREAERNDYNTELNNMTNTNTNNSTNGKLQPCHEEIKEKPDNEEGEDNWFSWVICLCAALIYMCNGGVFYSNGLLLPEFIRMLGCGEVVGTWVSSVQMGLCQFVALLGGALIELYGLRAVSLTGSALITIGLILSAFVNSVPLFFLTYSIIPGIGLGLQFMPCIVVVQYHFTAKRRATATGLVSAGSPLGIFVFAVLTRYLLDTYAIRGTLMLLGALNAHALAFALIIWPAGTKPKRQEQAENPEDEKEQKRLEIIPEEREPEKSTAEAINKAPETNNEKPKRCITLHKYASSIKKQALLNAKEIARTLHQVAQGITELRDVTVAGMFMACVTFCIGYQTPFIFMPITAELRGHGAWRGAYLVSVIGMADATSRIIVGFLGSVLPVSSTIMYAMGCLGAGIACLVGGYLQEYTPLVLACVAYGIGAATQTVLLAPVLVDLLGLDRIARLFGLANVGMGIGFLCSPPFQAFLYRVTKNISLPFYFGGTVQLLAAVCVLVVHLIHTRCRNRTMKKEPNLNMKKFGSTLLSNVSLTERSFHEKEKDLNMLKDYKDKDFDAYSHHSFLRSMTSLGDPYELRVNPGSTHNLPVVTMFGSTISIASHISGDPSRTPWYASVTSLERGPARV